MNKIPVKIALIRNSMGVEKITMGLNSRFYFNVEEDTHTKLLEFNKLYSQTINKINDIKTKNTPKGSKKSQIDSTTLWKIGRVLYQFNNKIENTFFITNYKVALRRDTGISYLDEIIAFGKYLEKNQVINKVRFYYYSRLIRKRSKLRKHGIFDEELAKLNQMGKNNKLPGYNKYNDMLKQSIKKSQQPKFF